MIMKVSLPLLDEIEKASVVVIDSAGGHCGGRGDQSSKASGLYSRITRANQCSHRLARCFSGLVVPNILLEIHAESICKVGVRMHAKQEIRLILTLMCTQNKHNGENNHL